MISGVGNMQIERLFESWRQVNRAQNHCGLAWYLAYEFCRRYYSSHGIVPHVICKDGLGYYGIQLDYLRCPVNGEDNETLGRMAMSGDVENWRTGGPGDHGLEATKLCDEGVPTAEIVSMAIRHMGLPSVPEKSHYGCRHKRWGSSYELVFEIAAIIAIRNNDGVQIWNHLYNTKRVIDELDDKAQMKEHPGAFALYGQGDKRVVIAGDGRMLTDRQCNVWERYMQGESVLELANEVEAILR